MDWFWKTTSGSNGDSGGYRTHRRAAISSTGTAKRLRHDVSPWVAPERREWRGIDTEPVESLAQSAMVLTRFDDDLVDLSPSRWVLRDDTFHGNLALFRPANVRTSPAGCVDCGLSRLRSAFGT